MEVGGIISRMSKSSTGDYNLIMRERERCVGVQYSLRIDFSVLFFNFCFSGFFIF